jgi:hypothetical protein
MLFHICGIVFLSTFINGCTAGKLYKWLDIYKENKHTDQLRKTALEGVKTALETKVMNQMKSQIMYAFARWDVIDATVPDFTKLRFEGGEVHHVRILRDGRESTTTKNLAVTTEGRATTLGSGSSFKTKGMIQKTMSLLHMEDRLEVLSSAEYRVMRLQNSRANETSGVMPERNDSGTMTELSGREGQVGGLRMNHSGVDLMRRMFPRMPTLGTAKSDPGPNRGGNGSGGGTYSRSSAKETNGQKLDAYLAEPQQEKSTLLKNAKWAEAQTEPGERAEGYMSDMIGHKYAGGSPSQHDRRNTDMIGHDRLSSVSDRASDFDSSMPLSSGAAFHTLEKSMEKRGGGIHASLHGENPLGDDVQARKEAVYTTVFQSIKTQYRKMYDDRQLHRQAMSCLLAAADGAEDVMIFDCLEDNKGIPDLQQLPLQVLPACTACATPHPHPTLCPFRSFRAQCLSTHCGVCVRSLSSAPPPPYSPKDHVRQAERRRRKLPVQASFVGAALAYGQQLLARGVYDGWA